MTTATPGASTFEEICTDLRPKLVGYLTRFVGAGEAEDLAQEVLLKVHQGLDTFRGQAKLTTWVFQIATHAALDRLKSAAHRASMAQVPEALLEQSQAHPSQAQDQQAMKEEMCHCIRGMVEGLPVQYRTIIYLSELEELRMGEIAEIAGISPGAAKIRLHRARQALRARMEQRCRIILDDQADLQCDRRVDG